MASFIAGALCLDYANSLNGILGSSYDSPRKSYDRLLAWCGEYGVLPSNRARDLSREAKRRPRATRTVLRRARNLGGAIESIFRARAGDRLPGDADLSTLNRELSTALREARVVLDENGVGWGWQDHPQALDQILWPVARSAAELLISEDCCRVRICAQDTCDWLFVDTSKNHRRRWCDMKTCGNRAKVRRFREKHMEN